MQQAGDAQGLGGAHFAGAIAELPVADLVQMLLLAGKQAVITVARDGVTSQVWCAAGEIVDAQSGLLRGEAALYRILGFEHGSLVAELREVPRERTISGNPTRLLLEGVRRKDESDVLRAKLGGEQRCYRRAGAAPEPAALGAPEVVLLRSFGAARSVSQVLASSDQGELETLTLLAAWFDAGVLVDAGQQPAPPLAASAPRATPLRRGTQLWGVLAALALVPASYLLGASSARTLARPAASVTEPLIAATVVEVVPASYLIQLQVEPAAAQITLDGEQVSVGHLEASLPRNGLVHELRVTAPGFIPTSIRFLDAAPPPQLRLEPLSPPSSASESPVVSASSDEQGQAGAKLYRKAAGARRPHTRGPSPTLKRRQLQGLERQEPVVEVIN
ncbi:MAG: DUF4388 domain-containing protein [Deltaproteobacteria bacterium]